MGENSRGNSRGVQTIRKVVGIHYGEPHEVHKVWMDAVGETKRLDIDHEPSITNIIRYALKVREVPDADVIICEGGVELRTAVVKKLLNPGTKIVRLVADQGLYEVEEKDRNGFEQKLLNRFVDGAITNSEFMKNYAEKFIDAPIEVVHPFVPDLERYLENNREYKETQEICFVGYNYPNKNVDVLVEAVKDLDVKLHIVGKGHDQRDDENVIVHGFVDDLEEVYDRCDIYVQPSDGDAFGVAPAEAMAYGIPTIVTDTTGIKNLIGELDEKLVAETSVKGIKGAIKSFYEKSFDERNQLSEKMREKVSVLSKDRSQKSFRDKFEKIVEDKI
ncbi:MAG: glycosyltransferase family 4 protein [Nanohaloarchaea archaeon]|nr:glycosyltransferase family 4 protein [Candidatus Nanohaloarchaea archaeon]